MVEDLTPKHLKCVAGASCPSVHRIVIDGKRHLIVVGKEALVYLVADAPGGSRFTELGDVPVGWDERAILIEEDLLSGIGSGCQANAAETGTGSAPQAAFQSGDSAEALREWAFVEQNTKCQCYGTGQVRSCLRCRAGDIIDRLSRGLSRETQLREQYQEDVDCVTMILDANMIDKEGPLGKFSLVGRVLAFGNRHGAQPPQRPIEEAGLPADERTADDEGSRGSAPHSGPYIPGSASLLPSQRRIEEAQRADERTTAGAEPNLTTQKAMEELEHGNLPVFPTVEAMMADLNAEDVADERTAEDSDRAEFKPCVIEYEEAGFTEMVLEDAFTVYRNEPSSGVELGYNGDGRLVAIRLPGRLGSSPKRPIDEARSADERTAEERDGSLTPKICNCHLHSHQVCDICAGGMPSEATGEPHSRGTTSEAIVDGQEPSCRL
jgi:hypothetical protein